MADEGEKKLEVEATAEIPEGEGVEERKEANASEEVKTATAEVEDWRESELANARELAKSLQAIVVLARSEVDILETELAKAKTSLEAKETRRLEVVAKVEALEMENWAIEIPPPPTASVATDTEFVPAEIKGKALAVKEVQVAKSDEPNGVRVDELNDIVSRLVTAISPKLAVAAPTGAESEAYRSKDNRPTDNERLKEEVVSHTKRMNKFIAEGRWEDARYEAESGLGKIHRIKLETGNPGTTRRKLHRGFRLGWVRAALAGFGVGEQVSKNQIRDHHKVLVPDESWSQEDQFWTRYLGEIHYYLY